MALARLSVLNKNGHFNIQTINYKEIKMQITTEKLYSLCNKYQWFTDGSIRQYECLFNKAKDGATIKELALIIWICSSNMANRKF